MLLKLHLSLVVMAATLFGQILGQDFEGPPMLPAGSIFTLNADHQ